MEDGSKKIEELFRPMNLFWLSVVTIVFSATYGSMILLLCQVSKWFLGAVGLPCIIGAGTIYSAKNKEAYKYFVYNFFTHKGQIPVHIFGFNILSFWLSVFVLSLIIFVIRKGLIG